jgi:putative flippase GtrA
MLLYTDMGSKKNKKQFILFCFVGLINTVLDLSMYFILHQVMGFPAYVVSPIIVFTVMSISYVLNAKIVFPTALKIKQYISFIVLTGLGVIVIQTTISTLFEKWAQEYLINLHIFSKNDLNIFIANSIVRVTGVVFSLAWNYLFYKNVVFRIDARQKPIKESDASEHVDQKN